MNIAARIDVAVERLRRKGWDFHTLEGAMWVDAIEAKIDRRLPEAYRSLVLRYSFPAVEIGPVILFANQGEPSNDDLSIAPFKDPILSPWLIRNGFFHFARSSFGDYDPICLEITPTSLSKTLSAVVKLDHEAILQERTIVPRETMAESFLGLLLDYA